MNAYLLLLFLFKSHLSINSNSFTSINEIEFKDKDNQHISSSNILGIQSKSFDYINFQSDILNISEKNKDTEPITFLKKLKKRTCNFFYLKKSLSKNRHNTKNDQNESFVKKSFNKKNVLNDQISDLYSIDRARKNDLSDIKKQVLSSNDVKKRNDNLNEKYNLVENDKLDSDSASYESIMVCNDSCKTSDIIMDYKQDEEILTDAEHTITCSCNYINCEFIKKINNLLSQDKQNDFKYRLYWMYRSDSNF